MYHRQLQNTYRRIIKGQLEAELRTSLAASVKRISGASGPVRFWLSAMVFGVFPRANSISKLPVQRKLVVERSGVVSLVCKKMENGME